MKIRKSLVINCVLLFALALRLLSETTANLSFLVLALLALYGRREAILALALSWLFTMLSPGLAPAATLGAVGRYAVIFAAAASVCLRFRPALYQMGQKRIIFFTLLLGVFLLLHSIFFSAMPDVSALKVVSWTVTVATLLAAWGGLSQSQSQQTIDLLFGWLTMVMLVSLPLLVLPIGYLRNGQGFQGVLGHPQAFGPTMSLLGIWLALGLLAQGRPHWHRVLTACLCIVLVIMSEARTAGLALLGGLVCAMLFAILHSRASVVSLYPGLRSPRVISALFLAVFMAVAFAPRVAEKMDMYISKRTEVDGVMAAYDRSRGRLINEMWANISKSPLTGIGFGIASNPQGMRISRDAIFDLPVGASIEKGVLPLAVVEEVGLFGLLAVLLWGWGVFRRALKGGGLPVGLLGTILLLNLGESTFFSVGGMGMLSMVLLGWIATRERPVRNNCNA